VHLVRKCGRDIINDSAKNWSNPVNIAISIFSVVIIILQDFLFFLVVHVVKVRSWT